MVELYDFSAHRAARLLDRISQQAGQVRVKMSISEASITQISGSLKQATQALNKLFPLLEKCKKSCVAVRRRNKECQQMLESEDIYELIEYRERLRSVLSAQVTQKNELRR